MTQAAVLQTFSDCWERSLYAFATAKIFDRRARKYRNLLQLLTAVGILVPLAAGGWLFSFGTDSETLKRFLPYGAVLLVVQLVVSGLAAIYTWPDKLEYSLTSSVENFALATQFEELAKRAANPPADLELQFVALKARDDSRRQADGQKSISHMELRYGHRAGLRQRKKACSACAQVPVSMTPTECDVCGKFRRWWS